MLGDNYPFIDKNKESYTPEEAIHILVKARMYDSVKDSIKRYGLEGTEEVIKDVYKGMPKLRDKLLSTLYEIWKG